METTEEVKTRRIYWMNYDRDHNDDGSMRKNEYLGTFTVEQQISEDTYSEEFIGIRNEDSKKYLVKGSERSGIGGGTRYSINEIN